MSAPMYEAEKAPQDAAQLEKMSEDGVSKGSRDVADHVDQGENKLTFGFFMTMVGLALAFIVAEVTPLFLVTCFTIIAADLNALDQVIWILVAPYIATGAIAPFVGNLSDVMGRRWIILLSLIMVVVAFIMQGAAPNFACYLAGSVIAGAAIGIQIMSVIAAASELVPMHKRGATIGYLALAIIPFAPGSLYGQLIAETSWRYIYLLLAIVSVLGFIVLFIWYRPPPTTISSGLTKMEIVKRIDYGGCLLSILGVVLFLIGINWGGGDYAWGSARVISFIVLGIVVLIVFCAYERWVVKYPMFPMRLVQSKRHFTAVAVLCLVSGVNYVPLTVFWTIQTYTVYGATFTEAGIWLLPLGLCIVGGAVISAIMISVFRKHVQWVLLLFCVMQTAGIGAMAAYDKDNIDTVWAPMVIGLIGVGGVLLPSQVVFSVISPDDLIGTSVALSVVIRMIGQVVGKSMFYNIFRERVTSIASNPENFDIMVFPAVEAGFASPDRIIALVNQLTAGPLQFYVDRGLFPEITDPASVAILQAAGAELYSRAFGLLYLISIAWGGLACVSCLFLWGVDRYIDEHTAVHM